MKDLLEEATKMLRSMSDGNSGSSSGPVDSSGSSSGEDRKDVMDRLQQQLNTLRMMKKFQLRSLNNQSVMGLIDSGATNPLRPPRTGESLEKYEEVEVAMADGSSARLRMTPEGTMISPDARVEPIIPMGLLTSLLGCRVEWESSMMKVYHPSRGELQVEMKGGCPHLSRSLTLELIYEVEELKKGTPLNAEEREKEFQWISALVEAHPVLSKLPDYVKDKLKVRPGDWSDLPVNKRKRKRLKKAGVVAHLYSGEDSGFTMQRAWKQLGGPEDLLVEIDILRGRDQDMLSDVGPFGGLLRAAMDGKLLAVVGGPNCRTRSVLRHRPIPDQPNAPRPIRRWDNGEENGIKDATPEELLKIQEDDIMAWRQVFVFMIAEYVRKARQKTKKVGFLFEHPAAPKGNEEVVSWWWTEEWQKVKKEFSLEEVNLNQKDLGGAGNKPTTLGTNMEMEVGEDVIRPQTGKMVKSSKELARWAPGLMVLVVKAILKEILLQSVQLRPLSWDEHIKMNHVPYRRDCLICQQTAQSPPHRRVRYPHAGTLSLDTVGPLLVSDDVDGTEAKYFIVGTLTWACPLGITTLKDAETVEIDELPDDAPEIDDPDEQPSSSSSKNIPDDAREAKQGSTEWLSGDQEVRQKGQEAAELPDKKGRDERGRDDDGDEGKIDEDNPPEGFVVKVFRSALPLSSKGGPEVIRGAMEMILRFKADGYHVSTIHVDKGGEYGEKFKAWARDRGIRISTTPGDEPKSNGRAEQSVKALKSQVRRTLAQGKVGSEKWPFALRYVNEVNRSWRLGQEPDWPPFYSQVLIRRRRWKRSTFEPTVEKAFYICPAPDEHGHWVQPEGEDERPRLTRSVLRKGAEPQTEGQWMAIEREVLDALTTRRRMREKSAVKKLEGSEDSLREEETGGQDKKMRKEVAKMVEEEMMLMMTDDPSLVYQEMQILGKLKKMAEKDEIEEEEVLQTKIVSHKEVWKNWPQWEVAVRDEVRSLLEDKGAMKQITKKELEELIRKADAEGKKVDVLPSKLVYTRKPGPNGGKLKARWVICGNYEPVKDEDTFSSGADAAALRILVTISSINQWTAGTLDVKTAFLNADMKLDDEKEVIVVKAPTILKEKGVIPLDAHYIPIKAVYGFRRSPRLWGLCRDEFLRLLKMEIHENGKILRLQLVQLESEPNLWKVEVIEEDEEKEPRLMGLLMTYVDDMFLSGTTEVVQELQKCIQAKWATSAPDVVGTEPIRFLGMQISKRLNPDTGRDDWYMSQSSFTRDLLKKEGENVKPRKIPITRDQSIMPVEAESDRTPAQIQQAQKATGEALWLVTRTRPDLMFSVSRMGSNITKYPCRVLEIYDQLKGYLASNPDDGLVFSTLEEVERTLDVETDSSFAPSGEASHGAYIVTLCGCPIFWRSGRQSLVTLSTAESEMVEVVEGMMAGEAIAVIAEELMLGIQKRIWTDSQSAVSILTSEGGNWRTRHLRMRSAAARQAIQRGEWLLRHRMGEELAADLGTKALTSARLEKLKTAMGMKTVPEESQEEPKEEEHRGERREGGGSLKKVIQLITLAAALTCSKGQPEEDEKGEEVNFEWMMFIYTVIVIAVTFLLQQIWGIGLGFQVPGDAREARPKPTEWLPGEMSVRSVDACPERETVQSSEGPLPDRVLEAGGEPTVELSGDTDLRPDAPLVMPGPTDAHGRDEPNESSATIEDEVEWMIERINEEERQMWSEIRQHPERREKWRVDDQNFDLPFEVYTTRYGSVYHETTQCHYLRSVQTGAFRRSTWCRLCRAVAFFGRGRPPFGVSVWRTRWGDIVHTSDQCPLNINGQIFPCCTSCDQLRRAAWVGFAVSFEPPKGECWT